MAGIERSIVATVLQLPTGFPPQSLFLQHLLHIPHSADSNRGLTHIVGTATLALAFALGLESHMGVGGATYKDMAFLKHFTHQ